MFSVLKFAFHFITVRERRPVNFVDLGLKPQGVLLTPQLSQ